MFFLVPALFIIVHGPSGDQARRYEGQDQQTVSGLIKDEGKTCDFVTESDFNTFMVANDPPSPAPARLAAKAKARLDVKNTALTIVQRLQALLILQDLDQ